MKKRQATGSSQILHQSLLIAISVTAVIVLLTVMLSNPIIAWFKNNLTVENPAQLTNFTADAQYRFGTSGSFTTLSAGGKITVTPDNINTLQIRVRYRGIASHYIRVSLFGGFYNKNTGTYLPLKGDSQAAVFKATGTSWVTSDDYIYYKSLLKTKSSVTDLATLTVGADTASWANRSDYQDYEGELYVLVDAVQANRISAFWGISAPPTA